MLLARITRDSDTHRRAVDHIKRHLAGSAIELYAGPTSQLAMGPRRLTSALTLHEENPHLLKRLREQWQGHGSAPVFIGGAPAALDDSTHGAFDSVACLWAGYRRDFDILVRAASRLLRPGGSFLFFAGDASAFASFVGQLEGRARGNEGLLSDLARTLPVSRSTHDIASVLRRHGMADVSPCDTATGLTAVVATRRGRPLHAQDGRRIAGHRGR
jgi:hypothetical protein